MLDVLKSGFCKRPEGSSVSLLEMAWKLVSPRMAYLSGGGKCHMSQAQGTRKWCHRSGYPTDYSIQLLQVPIGRPKSTCMP